MSDINKKSGSPSLISNYRLDSNHKINWNKILIVAEKLSYNKRIVSEMVYIKKQQQVLKKQSDTELLLDVYQSITDWSPFPS